MRNRKDDFIKQKRIMQILIGILAIMCLVFYGEKFALAQQTETTINDNNIIITNQQTEIDNLKKENQKLKEQVKALKKENSKLKNSQQKKDKTKLKSYKEQKNMHFKSYTNYKCLSRSSAQWKLQKKAYTDKNGLRKIGDDYLVAMGSYYTKHLGDRFKITLSTGKSFTIRICDFKANSDTNSTHQYTANGCMIEFYVDSNLNSKARQMGDISYIKGFKGNITKIEKIIKE